MFVIGSREVRVELGSIFRDRLDLPGETGSECRASTAGAAGPQRQCERATATDQHDALSRASDRRIEQRTLEEDCVPPILATCER